MSVSSRRLRTWQVLAGVSEPRYEMERELASFQIKFWLTGTSDMDVSFQDASVLYTLKKFSRGFDSYKMATSGWRMRDLLRHPSYKMLFTRAFPHGDLFRIAEMCSFSDEVELRRDWKKRIEFQIELAKARLAFITQRNDRRLLAAETYLERCRKPGVLGLSKGEEGNQLRPKAAYLVAAASVIPSMLNFDESALDNLDHEVPDPEEFCQFCRVARAVARCLGDAPDEQIERWIGCDVGDLPELEMIPQPVLDALQPKGRRAASETSKGKASRRISS
ncbi:hypothetical protein [Lichenihabitans psoromatis]|uniref:hypothetical protein n=1 Tax=Lichenihabitans psoromatis TaxID=2528642 RepID=UPI001038402C|nr:hypothetical protein [Lichenihabitans psoromatis]